MRPPTPSLRSPREGEMYEPISPVTSPGRRTPRYGGMVVGLEPERLSEIQEASGMIYNPAVAMAGGNFVAHRHTRVDSRRNGNRDLSNVVSKE